MSFHEIQFPTNLSYGSSGGPEFRTDILVVNSGREERICKWSQPRRKYNVSYALRSYTDLNAVKTFYMARSGALHGFRFKDWNDYTGVAQTIGVGDGSTTTFQLVKRYTSSYFNRVRYIKKPVTGSVAIAFNGVNQPSGWTVSVITGVVTFSSAPAVSIVITATYEFDVPVRFEESDILSISHEDFGSGAVPSINVFEIPNEEEQVQDYHSGGGQWRDLLVSADTFTSICPTYGFAIRHDNPNDKDMRLPDIAKIPTGGPIMSITHGGNCNLVDPNNNLVHAAPANNNFDLLVGINRDGEKVWLLAGEEVNDVP